MPKITWDGTGDKIFETGTDRGVLYPISNTGTYPMGVPWNGLTAVTESPSGAESNPQYADNIKYLDLISAEEFGGTIEAFTWPDEFGECDGSAEPLPGLVVGQQNRKRFGFSYRTLVGNDTQGQNFGYKIHIWYGALAAPSEKGFTSINDSPEAVTFSWEVTTSPVNVGGLRPAASLTIDSTKATPEAMAAIEAILYGSETNPARLPLPDEIVTILTAASGLIEATPTAPAFDQGTNTITIPTVVGVVYVIDSVNQTAGDVVITENTRVDATPAAGYKFPVAATTFWNYTFA